MQQLYTGAGIADVDNDGVNEILFPANDAMFCFEADGTEKWSYDPTADWNYLFESGNWISRGRWEPAGGVHHIFVHVTNVSP